MSQKVMGESLSSKSCKSKHDTERQVNIFLFIEIAIAEHLADKEREIRARERRVDELEKRWTLRGK